MPYLIRTSGTCLAMLVGLALAVPAQADSFTSWAASTASQVVGSVSTSVQGSSDSSSRGGKVAAGEYDVTTVATAQNRPDTVRLHLKATAATKTVDGDDGSFVLELPRAALGERGIAVGDTVSVRHRAYGYEFARARTQETFFLALADAWMRDLEARPI